MNSTAPVGILFRYFGFRYLGWVFASVMGLTATVTLIQAIELARRASSKLCLLYTSDAGDEGLGVDLGGRRII